MFNLIFTDDFSLENQGAEEKYITKLENLILDYNSELLLGVTRVDDATYTNCVELLSMLRPNSPVLRNDKDVKFIKNLDEETVEYIKSEIGDSDILRFYLNPQGLNVRLVYEDGELVDAVTFGRSFKKQNVLDLMIRVLTNRNDYLSEISHVEIEGVLVLANENIDIAKEFCVVKNSYQGLFSLLSYDATHEDEIENLEDIIYFIATDVSIDGIPFNTINEKYEALESFEFLIPEFFEIERTDNLVYDLEDALYRAENEKTVYEYLTDGLRLLVLSDAIILLKVGSWRITSFEGIVDRIEWIDEKCKKLPVLKLKEPIVISEDEDFIISEIVLNSINLLLILCIELNEPIRFAYFGGMGILPITENDEIILN